jgi:hypothetical protein
MDSQRNFRLMVSGFILTLFWGAILYSYWPSLAPAALHLINATRSAGAPTMESRHFQVHNTSSASESQVEGLIQTLDNQYRVITSYTRSRPPGQLEVLVVNGHGPAVIDGPQLVINFDGDQMDTTLVPFFMVFLIEDIKINPAGEIVAPGGQALQVVEAAGLGNQLIRQPLDAWTVLLRQRNGYLPLEKAWKVSVPNDDASLYSLLRALLESGSFMRWFTVKYGLDAAQRVARGETVEDVSGKSLAENEVEWLQWLDGQKIQPKPCEVAIPKDSVFRTICTNLDKPAQ